MALHKSVEKCPSPHPLLECTRLAVLSSAIIAVGTGRDLSLESRRALGDSAEVSCVQQYRDSSSKYFCRDKTSPVKSTDLHMGVRTSATVFGGAQMCRTMCSYR